MATRLTPTTVLRCLQATHGEIFQPALATYEPNQTMCSTLELGSAPRPHTCTVARRAAALLSAALRDAGAHVRHAVGATNRVQHNGAPNAAVERVSSAYVRCCGGCEYACRPGARAQQVQRVVLGAAARRPSTHPAVPAAGLTWRSAKHSLNVHEQRPCSASHRCKPAMEAGTRYAT